MFGLLSWKLLLHVLLWKHTIDISRWSCNDGTVTVTVSCNNWTGNPIEQIFVSRTQDHRNFWNITTSKICFRMLSAIGGKERLAKLLPQPTRGHLTTWNVRIVFSITGTSRSQLKRGKTCLLFFLIWVPHRLLLYMLSTSCKIVMVSLWSSPQFPVAFWILSRKKSKWSYYKSYQSIFLSLHSHMVYSDMTYLLFPPQRPVSPS